ncbi:MAG: hypothetical protein DSY80_03845 [Desulfocapsa sp.]|nr:MAG: hypothetical protein DSY80_03845 [Desulfocapsa sp.]
MAPTPIKVKKLHKHLQEANYDHNITKYLIDGFRYGFSLQNTSKPITHPPTYSKTIESNKHIIRQKLDQEIKQNRIAGPFDKPPFSQFHISPLNIREKKDKGKHRLIHNLSFPYDGTSINANIPNQSKTVHFASVRDAINILLLLPHSSYTAKTDITDAYRLIPIKPEDHPKLGMHFDGKYYFDKCLPQGCASSCKIFETFSTAIQAIFQHYHPQAHCVHMIDDFLILADTQAKCRHNLNNLLALCRDIGIPMAPNKTTNPSTNTTFLGIELDTVTRSTKLPKDKLIDYSALLDQYLRQNKITKHNLESLIGKLNFAASVVPARPFLRRLIDLLNPLHKPYYYIRLTKEVKQDLHTWKQFLMQYNGITYFRSLHIATSAAIHMSADASHIGFGACYGSHWIQAPYPKHWTTYHITVLEMYPIYVLIEMFGYKLLHSNILFYTDNTAVKDIINKQTSREKTVMQIVRPLVLTLVKFNINLRSKHIPGILNILPDAISRFKVSKTMLKQHNMKENPTPIPTHLLPQNFGIGSTKTS